MKQKRHPTPRRKSPRPPRPNDFVNIPKSWRVIVGHHAIKEGFLTTPNTIRQLWLKQGFESSQELREFEKMAKERSIEVQFHPGAFLDRFCASHQGAALLKEGRPQLDESSSADISTRLILDGIEDPHNLGAILRTSWLMKVDGLYIAEDRAVGLTPTVHKVACGGAEHVPIQSVVNFSSSVESLKEQGYWVFGLSHKAKKTVFDLKIPEKIVWAIGAEDKGLRITTERLCDELVSIPQATDAASYNASVAAAIALTETFRQRRHFFS